MAVLSAGQAAVLSLLPDDMRRPDVLLDKGGMKKLLRELRERHPDKYAKVVGQLMRLGGLMAEADGASLSLAAIRPPPRVRKALEQLRSEVEVIDSNRRLSPEKRSDLRQQLVYDRMEAIKKMLVDEATASGNPLAAQISSGSRGNATQLQQIVAGDGLVQDHRGRVISTPILHGYTSGLDPVEYWAGSYGARHGMASTKLLTADSGYLNKLVNQASHRLVVTEDDCGTAAGIPVQGNDPDNVGSVLASKTGKLDPGTLLSAGDIKSLGEDTVYVRSPMTCQAASGVCRKCAGARSKGRLPDIGDNLGIPSAQAITEKITQGALSAKHSGGVSSKKKHTRPVGFKHLQSIMSLGSSVNESATMSEIDGRVMSIKEAPQGGWFVRVDGTDYHVPSSQNVTVEIGQEVEAGDTLSDGTPNPAELVRYKGLGEGRLVFLNTLRQALKDSGVSPHRRNIETLTRGLVNHVRVTSPEGFAGFLPDDIVPYEYVASAYSPRDSSTQLPLDRARGKYIEQPVLHYTPGTRVTQRMIENARKQGLKDLLVNDDPPPFEPVPVRAIENAMRDPNWMTRLHGSYLEKGLTDAVHRSASAPLVGETSYVPSLAQASDFGKDLRTQGAY